MRILLAGLVALAAGCNGVPALAQSPAPGTGLSARVQSLGNLSMDQTSQRGLALAFPGADSPRLWFKTTYDTLSARLPAVAGTGVVPHVHMDLSQTLFGAELRRGAWLVGLAGSAAAARGQQDAITFGQAIAGAAGPYSNAKSIRYDIDPRRIETEAYAISPYVAFAATKQAILTGAIGYTRRDFRLRPGSQTITVTQEFGPGWQALGLPASKSSTMRYAGLGTATTDGTVSTDIAANLVAPIGETGVILAGRLGYRHASTWATPFTGSATGVQTTYLGAQAFYRRGQFTPFARIQWEYSNPTTGTAQYAAKYPRDAVYLTAGIDYRMTESIAGGISVMTQEANPSITHRQVALTLRYNF